MKRPVPRLSIVTPVFNGAAHVVSCMDNVREQAQPDIEHLLVDGGSTDGTPALIRERMQHDAAVRLIEGPDHGQSHAINKGVVAAQGAIIGILNVDDQYKPGALALALEMFRNAAEPAFLWGACEVDDQLHGGVWVQRPGKFVTWRMAVGYAFEPHPINPVAYFYHRSLHYTAGLYDEAEHFAMDLDFLLRVPRHLKQVMVTDTVLGVYHLTPETKTFVDIERGTNVARARDVYQRSVATLSLVDRLRYEVARRSRAGQSR